MDNAQEFAEGAGQRIVDHAGEAVGPSAGSSGADSDPEPLGDDEIEIAKQNIAEMYPLKSTPLTQLFPYLCCILKRKGFSNVVGMAMLDDTDKEADADAEESFRDDDERLNKVIRDAGMKPYTGTDFVKDSADKYSTNEKRHQSDADPMMQYGFGVVAYFKLLTSMIWVLLILSIKGFFIMGLYAQFKIRIDLSSASSIGRTVFTSSLGRLPRADVFCHQKFYVSEQPFSLNCSAGTIVTTAADLNYGFITPKGNQTYIHGNREDPVYHDYCGPNTDITNREADCTDQIDSARFIADYNAACLGQRACIIDFKRYLPSPVSPRCAADPDAYFYIKAECRLSQAETTHNQMIGVAVVLYGLMMCLCYTLMLSYLE